MIQQLRNIVYSIKAALFTVAIHGVIIAALVAGLWWPFSPSPPKSNAVVPVQARVIGDYQSADQVKKQAAIIEEQKRVATELAEQQKIKALEVQRKKASEAKNERLRQEQAERLKREKQQKLEKEKKRKEAEDLRQVEEEQKRQAEKKRKAEEEKKRKVEAEKQQKIEEENKRREQELRKQLEAEQAAQIQADAEHALRSFVPRIQAAINGVWIRPASGKIGLVALIQIHVSRNGDVLSAQVIQSSGDSFFDRSAEVAAKKASPLPLPPNPNYYEHNKIFNINFRPGDS